MPVNSILRKVLFIAFGLMTSVASAHPVAFDGAWILMNFNRGPWHDIDALYSFKPYAAGGVSAVRNEDNHFVFARGNLLLKRWNQADSQGNVYLSLGAGEERQGSLQASAGLGEFMADWENRRFYVLGKHRVLLRESSEAWVRENVEMSQLRAGFAPYLGETDQLNTWVIGQLDQGPTMERDFSMLLRFYYQNVLWEIGSSMNGHAVFNFMVHL